ncbi:RTA1 like protein-domain-containing protein [Xylariales sp. PMI_506]|nr:RTA1 like protein-domain-containing protein [Xylariales sp. PMI_506]
MASPGDCSEGRCAYDSLQYEPSLAGNVTLLALFAILVPITLILAFQYQSSVFSTTIVTGLLLEILGYVGRILLATGTHAYLAAFTIFLIGTIVAPAVISLAIFRLMPPIVGVYGETFQPWRPRWHNVVFYAFTAACVALGVVGSVLSTVSQDFMVNTIGVRLQVASLAILTSSLVLFAFLGFRFATAVRQQKVYLNANTQLAYNNTRFKVFLIGMTVATILLIARTVYRMILIGERNSSGLSQNEVLFLVLDGALVFVATLLVVALFPSRMLEETSQEIYESPRPNSHKLPRRPSPIQLQQAPYDPTYSRNRVSLKSSITSSPKHSPRKSAPPPQRNMVDSETLW